MPTAMNTPVVPSQPSARLVRESPYVLVADDDPDLCELLTSVLTRSGCSVLTFPSGNDLLTYMASWMLDPASLRKPDAMIVDVRMPGFAGLDALRDIDSDRAYLPLIVMSAHDDTYTRKQAERLGALAFLRKPIHSAELLAVVDAATETGRWR